MSRIESTCDFFPCKSAYRKGRVIPSLAYTLPGLKGPLHRLRAFHVDGKIVYVLSKYCGMGRLWAPSGSVAVISCNFRQRV